MNSFILSNLNHFQYEIGLINLDQYKEYKKIVEWLYDSSNTLKDPRFNNDDEKFLENHETSQCEILCEESNEERENYKFNRNNILYFNTTNIHGIKTKWIFTISDPDSYPSVPHGHHKNQKNTWPKLNPYNGIAYETKNSIYMLLSKNELKKLWDDEKFRKFCFDAVTWYSNFEPNYVYPTRNKYRFPKY